MAEDNRILTNNGVEKIKNNVLPLTLDNVSYEINGMRLVKDITTSFEANSVSVIIGPNGAGKSLLLRLCHGLIKPSKGKLLWEGIKGKAPEKHQTMVFQRPIMLRRSVFANINHGLRVRKIPRSERNQIIESTLHHTGLFRLAKVPARQLSIGEQQRLAVARAWSLNPEVMFMDEPSAALDPAATHSLETIISDIRNSGTKIIMSTHDLGQAKRLGDDILFLYRGRLLERDRAKNFFDKPNNDRASSQIFFRCLQMKQG